MVKKKGLPLRQPCARVGFAVKVLGRQGLKSHDSRRWQSQPQLRVSLGHLRTIFDYLVEQDIHMYRMVSGLAPYATHPDHPEFHDQVGKCQDELAEIGSLARDAGLRLSFHPSQYIVLNAPDDGLAARSAADIEVQAAILEAMGLDDEAVVVIHVGGVYGDRRTARERFVERYGALSPIARRRLVVENDDGRFGVGDALWLNERVGIRVVFDVHHHHCHDPDGMDPGGAARACMDTWSGWRARPKIHYSSPRLDWGFRYGSDEKPHRPKWASHAEFGDPFAFAALIRTLQGSVPDVMIEAKAKDVAVVELRRALARYAPDVAAEFGWSAMDLMETEAHSEEP